MAEPDGAAGGGLRDAAQQVLASLLDIGRTRLELVTVELEEERLRIAALAIRAAVTLFLLFVGTVLAAGWIVLWCEPAYRLVALGALCAAFLAAAAVSGWQWRRLARGKAPLLGATVGELREDRRALRGAEAP